MLREPGIAFEKGGLTYDVLGSDGRPTVGLLAGWDVPLACCPAVVAAVPADQQAVEGSRGGSEATVGSEGLSAQEEWIEVELTFYVCRGAPPGFQDGYCDHPAGPLPLAESQAACGYAWPFGTRFEIAGDATGRTYICNDRGLGPEHWLDVFFWEYIDGRAWSDSIPRPARIRMVS